MRPRSRNLFHRAPAFLKQRPRLAALAPERFQLLSQQPPRGLARACKAPEVVWQEDVAEVRLELEDEVVGQRAREELDLDVGVLVGVLGRALPGLVYEARLEGAQRRRRREGGEDVGEEGCHFKLGGDFG